MKKLIMILACIIASVGLSVAQTTRVSGTILDDTGETVIGASVVAKGTTVGTVTDIDGNFSLNIPSDRKTLVISLIGMKTKEVAAGTDLKIVMENDSRLMDEVVVTAMGISRSKKALGYASQDVKSSELIQAGNSNLAGALQGKISGVQITPSSGMPGASSQIVIRGARSFTGNNTPLYIVDGMPVASTADMDTKNSVSGTDFANRAVDIDPNDIESINILKGQAASALYGIRASNGVVVITTRSGKGAQKGKAQISYSTNVSFDKLSTFPELQTEYAQGNNGTYSPMQSMSWGPKISDLPNDATYGGNVANALNGGDTQKYQGKYYVQQRANAGLDPWATPQSYDNIKDFFETGTTFNNSLNIMQASDKTNYSFSLGSTNQNGIIPETGMHRYNAKLAAETKLTSQWTTGFVGNYIYSTITKQPTANDGLLATVYGSPASFDLAGIPAHYEGNPYKQNNYRTGSFAAAYWALDNNKFKETTNRFFGNVYTTYTTKLNTENQKLTMKYQLGTDSYTTNYTDTWGYGNKGSSNTGQIEEYSWNSVTVNSLLTANYEWKINEDLHFNALLGNEFIQDKTKYNYSYGADFNFPGWNHIKNATVTSNSESTRRKRNVGFFGNLSLVYKSMLFLDITGRQDYVSNMPTGNRSFFYPSVGASFVVSELEGVKNDFIDFLKIRASYAEVGQAGDFYNNYFYKPSYGSGFYNITPILYPINGVSGFVPYSNIYDPNLKPQNTKSYEFGFDLNFLNNIFSLNYTFARQNVNDQIFDVPLAGSTGASSMTTNGGKVHTNSHEITLGVNPIRTKNIDWNFAFNWTKIDNYVDELAPGVESIMLGGFVTPQVRAGLGDKFPVIYGVGYKRDTRGNIIVGENGIPLVGESKVIGKVSPDFLLGFNTNIKIQKFNIGAVLDWKSGGQMYSGTNGLLNLYGRGKDTGNRDKKIVVDGVKADGSRNDIAVTKQAYYVGINNIDESSIYDNSFIKLREVVVNYLVFKNSAIELSANVFARNIILWSELPNLDPESSQGNNNMAGAFERFSLPQTSSYGFGLNVKF